MDRANLTIEPGERMSLLGRNGTGKTTLLGLLPGALEPDGGEVIRQQGLRTAMLPQEVPRDLHGTVFDEVARGLGSAAELLAEYHQPAVRLAARAERTNCTPSWTASSTPWRPTAAGVCTRRSTASSRA